MFLGFFRDSLLEFSVPRVMFSFNCTRSTVLFFVCVFPTFSFSSAKAKVGVTSVHHLSGVPSVRVSCGMARIELIEKYLLQVSVPGGPSTCKAGEILL